MKKLLLTLASFGVVVAASAQIQPPNAGFENWTNAGSYDDPNNWQTLNVLSNALLGSNPVSVFKESTNPHSGTYCCKINSVALTSNPSPGNIPDTVGAIFTGAFNFVAQTIDFGYAYTSRPQSLSWWSRYTPAASGDTGFVVCALTHWNGTSTDTVAWGGSSIGAATNWTQYNSTLYYNPNLPSNTFPDTCVLLVSATDDVHLKAGSTLWVDDMAFTGWVGIDEQGAQKENVAVFPNPATNMVNITVNNDKATRVHVYDMTGRMVGDETFINRRVKLETLNLASGMYSYMILDESNTVMNRGKFSVSK